MHKPLEHKHPVIQLAALVGISIISLIAIMLLGVIVGAVVWGSDFSSSMLNSSQGGASVMYMKYLQLLSHLGMFIVPALIFGRLAGGRVLPYYTLNRGAKGSVFLLALLIIIASFPLINLLTEWNAALTLPESMRDIEQWMRQSEDEAAKMTQQFMQTTSVEGLLFNLFLMAIIPAIGEEVIFRGILQKQLIRLFRSPWVGLLLTAVVFSAIHMQFYGFLPRLILGLVLGYLFMATGKLWVPIFVHFVNNGLTVVAFWLYGNKMIDTDPEAIGNYNDNIPVLLGSMLLLGILIALFHKITAVAESKNTATEKTAENHE